MDVSVLSRLAVVCLVGCQDTIHFLCLAFLVDVPALTYSWHCLACFSFHCVFLLSLPLLVSHSGSMEPAIHRGDLLLLSNRYSTPLVSGDIVVYKLPGRDVPIVHRIIKVHEEHGTAAVDVLTKGDNNLPDDRELYGDRKWLSREMVMGRAFAFLPRAGMVRWSAWLDMILCTLFAVPDCRGWGPSLSAGGSVNASSVTAVTHRAGPAAAPACCACCIVGWGVLCVLSRWWRLSLVTMIERISLTSVDYLVFGYSLSAARLNGRECLQSPAPALVLDLDACIG